MDLLHNIDIIQTLKTRLGPADIFQILQRALLAVHIVGSVAGLGQHTAAVEHGGNIGIVGSAMLDHDVGRPLECQRVDRDVLRRKRDGLTQAGCKAFDRVPRQARDQVHIDVGVPCSARGRKAVDNILRCVAAADVLQDRVRKGLWVDGNTRRAVFFDDTQLFCIGAVGAAGLNGVFVQFR